ncbi:MAG TPA: PAS domain S-box protein, partial [Rhodocyclaceae bacterium]|nr:PAS domain S-box protein [Rhodocyclaceae bacterium]
MIESLEGKDFRWLFDASADAMLIVDAAGSVALANPAAKALFGYPDHEFSGLPVDSLVPARLRGRHSSHRTDYGVTPRKRMLAAGGDLYGLRKDGSEFAADIGLSPMDDGMVLVTIQDVTARRRMEKALTLFSRVVEQTASTVVITDADGVIEYVNPRFVETTGYTAAEAIGKTPSLLKSGRTPPDEYRRLWQTISRGEIWRGEFLNQRKDGSLYWESAIISPVLDERGQVTHYTAIEDDITERKHAEEALRLDSAMMSNVQAGIYLVRAGDFSIIHTNPNFDAMFGYAPGELLGRHVSVLNAPTERSPREISREIVAELEHDGTWSGEVLSMRKDGATFWSFLTISSFEHAERGGVWVAARQDISKRKQAEEALRASEAKFRSYIEHSPVAVFVTDERGRYVDCNPAATALLGYDTAALLHMHVLDIVPEPDHERTAAEFARLVGEGRLEAEYRLRRSDGALVWASLRAVRVDANRFMAFCQDIGERKRAEDALREAEQRFRATFEQAAVGIAHVAPDGRWLRMNRKLCEILGYAREELLGRTFQDITFAEDLDPDMAQVRRLLAGEADAYSMEKRYLRKDGGAVWANLTVALVRRADGQPDYFISVVEDIEERRRAETALRELRAKMDRLMAVQVAGQTVAALAHELNQPLNAVSSYAEAALRLLRAGNPRPEKLTHALENSAQQAQRAGRVVRELMEFLRQGEAQTEPVDLDECLRRALQGAQAAGYGGFRPVLEMEAGLPPVQANCLQIEKVLATLVQNGVEAMRDAGTKSPTVTLTLRAVQDAGMAQVTVADNGPGMDQQT